MSKTLKVVLGGGALIVVIIGVAILINYRRYAYNATSSFSSYDIDVDGGIAPSDLGISQPSATGLSEKAKFAAPTAMQREPSGRTGLVADSPERLVAPSEEQAAVDRLIIKSGSMSVVVKDVAGSIKAITNYAEKVGGFVVASNVYKSGDAPYGVVTIRIPAQIFEQGLAEVKGLGEVLSEDIRGTDVTEEYVDLTSQLKNLRAAEEQFLSIMKRAEKVEDILAVQNQLTYVRGQIEGIEGRMKYLKQSAELSSLTINLSTDPSVLPVVNKETDKWKPIVVVKKALRSLVEVGKGLINFLIWVVIFSPVWAGIIVIGWLIYRKIHNKNRK